MDVKIRPEDCEAAVRNYLGKSDFSIIDYEVKSLGDKIIGLMGRYCKIVASVQTSNAVEEIYFFVKLPPITERHRSFVIGRDFFHREIVVYSRLVPELRASLPPGTVLPWPKCLFYRDTVIQKGIPTPGSADEELLVLEDLTHRGYKMLEKFDFLDLPHIHVVLKTLARLHASSIMLEDIQKNKPIEDTPCKVSFKDGLWRREPRNSYVANSLGRTATAITAIWPDRFGGQREKILESLQRAYLTTFEACRDTKKYAKVFVHGDAWANNIMFSYERDKEGVIKPCDAVLVDAQVVQYAPPIYDIILFLHVSTKSSFRCENLITLLEYYHEALSTFIPSGLMQSSIPFEDLLRSYEDFEMIGRVVSCTYLPTILELCDDTLAKKGKRGRTLNVEEVLFREMGVAIADNCKISEVFRERMEECLSDCLKGLGLWK